MYGLPPGQPSV